MIEAKRPGPGKMDTGARRARAWLLAAFVLALAALFASAPAVAHPEDDFCTPGEDGMDPELCRALRELNSAEPAPGGDGSDAAGDAGQAGLAVERGAGETFLTYIRIGVGHILPGGLDHILFVVAFFLSSTRLRALLWQIGAFTVAHTVTLGLAAAGAISPPASIVEPFIALSIAWVAVENLVREDTSRWRTALVFAFGLVHGMGFAGFFGTLGLPPGQFFSALIGFNVGVEIGQLAVIASALALTWPLRSRVDTIIGAARYRKFVVFPASAVIAVTALTWFVQRAMA